MKVSKRDSPFSARLRLKLLAAGWSVSHKDAMVIQHAFVEALKEEVETRAGAGTDVRPLVIAGLGSFKMRTRPERGFPVGPGVRDALSGKMASTVKPPARRLVFTSKWEVLP